MLRKQMLSFKRSGENHQKIQSTVSQAEMMLTAGCRFMIAEAPPVCDEACAALRFPDMTTAPAWYNSPAYQQARPHRMKGAKHRMLRV
jgi:uncharacterized protein (DUF1330 family)